MAFVPLFCRSHHSAQGVASPVDLVRRARSVGYSTLGLCDEATMAGFLAFENACRAQGIRPVFGARLPTRGLAYTGLNFPIDFLIETEQGYRNLVRLVTRYHRAGQGGKRPLETEDFLDRMHGLVAVIPPDGELAELTRQRDRVKTEQFIERAADLFEAQLVFGLTLQEEENRPVAESILKLANFLKIRAIAAPMVLYPEPGDLAASIYLQNPRQPPGRSYTPPAGYKASAPALWPESDVLERWAGAFDDAAHEAGNVARRCTWRLGRIRRAFPTRDLERGFDANSYLFDLAIRGATQRYGEITENLKQRLNREIEDVKAHHLAPYLLLNHQIMNALDGMGISRGVGRGRMVCLVLAYCLGLTRIDPLQYNLASRSLLGEGETFPLVAIEVPRKGVEPLIDWLRETFGAENLAEIGRVQEVRRDQMIQELATWAGMTADERRMIQREKARLRSTGAAQRLGELTEGSHSRRWRDPALLGDVVARLAPRPRQWQASGDRYVLSGEPLEVIVPLVAAQQGRPATGIEDAAIDRLGLARLVFTPHGLLDVLDQAIAGARAQNPRFAGTNLPLDDRPTFELLSRGETSGIPPLEPIRVRYKLRHESVKNLLQLLRVKTEAAGEAARRELYDELPDVLLSYQCAYLKANYPLAFYGAAIGAAVEQRRNPAALVREAHRAGYHVQPPDINLSDWGTSLHAGNIRLGLATVRGFGQRAWDNVQGVRSGGPFTSLESFCERTDTRTINLRLLRTLIASGAMDGLGPNRATMDESVARLQKRMRDRPQEESRRDEQATLFDLDEWVEGEEPEPETGGELEEWNTWEKCQRESEALGFYLSIDPLQRFRIVQEHLRPLSVESVSPRHAGREVRVIGLVCGQGSGTGLEKELEGKVLVDLEGLPVCLPEAVAELSETCLQEGQEVMVAGTVRRRHGVVYLEATGIWRLIDLEDQATKVATLRLSLAGENRETLKMLLDLVRQYPGNSQLELTDYPGPKRLLFRRVGKSSVFFCSPLYQGLCKILMPEAIALFGGDGEPLLAKTQPMPENEEDESAPEASSEAEGMEEGA